MSNPTLAARQAALVAALVAGAPVPAGFDQHRVAVTERALRGKRAGEVALAWPRLAAAFGARWGEHFGRWARGRPPQGTLRDGWDLARELRSLGQLPTSAAAELAVREAAMRYDGARPPRRRYGPTVRRLPGGVVLGYLGRVRVLQR